MTNLIIQKIDKQQLRADLPEIKAGYTVRVHQKIKEGDKERVQIYEGLVIKVSHGNGPSKTMTVRKVVEGIGVEKIFPLHSPNVVKIEVARIGKVRRSKLYYMRDVSGKAARLKEVLVSRKEKGATAEVTTIEPEQKTEAVIDDQATQSAVGEATAEQMSISEETPSTTDNAEEVK